MNSNLDVRDNEFWYNTRHFGRKNHLGFYNEKKDKRQQCSWPSTMYTRKKGRLDTL